MKRLVFVFLILALSIPAIASAQEGANASVGKIGLGYTYSNAPVGIRMWFSQDFGFDAGLGFVLNGEEPDIESDDGDDTTITTDWAIDAGFLASLYRGQNSIFFGRIGLNLDRRYAQGRENDNDPVHSSVETYSLNGMLGIELFMTALGFPELSLQGAVGLGFQYVSPAEQVGDEDGDWSFGSMATSLSLVQSAQLGFHYYFDL